MSDIGSLVPSWRANSETRHSFRRAAGQRGAVVGALGFAIEDRPIQTGQDEVLDQLARLLLWR